MPTFNTDTPKPGYVYDSSDDTWYPLAGIAIQSLDGLTDVVISSAASGQALVYNGTNWVNTAETGDVSAVSAGTGITVTNGTGPIPSIAIDTATTVDLSTAQTLTNKTINLTSNTLSGTTAQFNTALSDGDFATIAGTETLTNKTLTTPTLQNPSVTSGTFIGGTFTSAPAIDRPTITGTTQIAQILESAAVTSYSATGTVVYNVLDQGAVAYFTSSASSNWTLNLRGSSTTSLVNLVSTGQSLTIAMLVTNGATAFYQTAMQIDGTAVTSVTKWQGGTAPSSGNASSVDIYSITAIKVANTSTVASAFTLFAAQTKFA